MNTMPQSFDPRPLVRAGFSVSNPVVARRAPAGHLTLVGGAAMPAPAAWTSSHSTAAAAAAPAAAYDLTSRRHLAHVPGRGPGQASAAPGAQAASRSADNAGTTAPPARPPAPLPLEPLVFALVLLVSVAALAVAMRAA